MSTRPHILVVDDDARIRELVSRYLEEQQFVVMAAQDAAEARKMVENFSFDALVVDIMMPGETGLELTEFLQSHYKTPVILLTALGETDDRIKGLEAGADDYLTKPFEPRELVLRLNAIIRRTAELKEAERPFRIGRWHFHPDREELVDDWDQHVRLTGTEAMLIRTLAAKPGQVMSREELAERCGVEAGERTIDVQVTRLRRKIEEDTKAPRYLQTVRGKGYLLRIEDL